MIGKYVLDSSIWIELERQNKRVRDKVLPFIEKNEVCLIDIIVAEVLRGTKTKANFKTLKELFLNFNILKGDWFEVAELAFLVGKEGFWPPLADLYIAQCVKKYHKTLITQDHDFLHIRKVIPFKLDLLPYP